jgi:hypothetical protein
MGSELLITISGPGAAAKNLLISREKPVCHHKYPVTVTRRRSAVRKNGLLAFMYAINDEKNDDVSMGKGRAL